MVWASGYANAKVTTTWANSKPERSGVGKVKCRPAFGSTAQKTLAVPQRSYSLSRLASRPGLAGDAGRTSACSVTGFSSRQTTGCWGSYGFSSHAGNQPAFYGFFGHQSNRPASAAFRRATADHGNQTLFLALVQHFRSSRPLLLI